jgi:hypothetical protein
MRRIRVKAIHNHLDLVVRWPTTAGGTLEVPQKTDLEGSWLIEYDEAEHPELENVGEENEVWFTVSPHEFTWGTITFGEPTFPVASLEEILTRE